MMDTNNNCSISVSTSTSNLSTGDIVYGYDYSRPYGTINNDAIISQEETYKQTITNYLNYSRLYDSIINNRIGEIEDANKNLINAIYENGGSFKIVKDPTRSDCYKAHIVIETQKLNRISVEVKDNFECNTNCITDLIDRIDIYNGVAVKVSFKDGTFTKSVAESIEDFDLYTGVAFCLFKKFLGGDGHKNFNKMMRSAMKKFDELEENKKKEEEEKKRQNEKRKKLIMKKKAKKMKEKEEAIDIQKQGYLRAMKECQEIE